MFSLNPAIVEIDFSASQDVLELARAGNADAFCDLCRIYETRLLRQALTLCGNSSLAEDLAQDTLVEAWKCLPRYNGRCQFFTWLCAILLNRYRNTVRQKRPLPFSSFPMHDQMEFQSSLNRLADSDSLPDQSVQIREQAALVLECIRSLPIIHQQVVYLRFYVDDSFEAIGEALGCSVGTVKSRLFRALDKLRAMSAINKQGANLETKGSLL